jgi:ornithine cyclodeaminase
MIELDELVAGKRKGRSSPDELTLFCSVGLAGTEVVLADAAFKSLTK